jgi:hypothetical protein
MSHISKWSSCLMAGIMLLGCVDEPADVVRAARDDYLSERREAFTEHFTSSSRAFLAVVEDVLPLTRRGFTAAPAPLGIEAQVGEGAAIVQVSEGGEVWSLRLVREDGRWRIDLIGTDLLAGDRKRP